MNFISGVIIKILLLCLLDYVCDISFIAYCLLAFVALYVVDSMCLSEKHQHIITGGGKSYKINTFHNKYITAEDGKKLNFTPAEVKQLLSDNGYTPNVSHISNEAEQADKLVRIINRDFPETKYTERIGLNRLIHWGQLKLLLSEIEFLNKVMAKYKDSRSTLPILMVYAGASPGNHIKCLAYMFPTVHFELYDPNKFAIRDSNKIRTHVQFFTDVDAKYWAEQSDKWYIVFCSDIRIVPTTEGNVQLNMDMQKTWWSIIKPELSIFKFRLPWKPGTTEYPEGDIYIQAFVGQTSTETRLIVEKGAKLINYDNTKYENQCFHHNEITRKKRYNHILGDSKLCEHGVDNCYDCATFVHIAKEYVKYKTPNISDVNLVKRTRHWVTYIIDNTTFGNANLCTQTIIWLNTYLRNMLRVYTKYKTNNIEKLSIAEYFKQDRIPYDATAKKPGRKSKATKSAMDKYQTNL